MIRQSVAFLIGTTLLGAPIPSDPQQWQRPHLIPAPHDNSINEEKIALGKKLFFDPILSRDRSLSCATCHDPVHGWADANRAAIGIEGRQGTRNSPTIINGAYQLSYFWDGRAKSLEEQSLGPIESHVEMDLKPSEAVHRLQYSPAYVKAFEIAFPKEGITVQTLAKAIASFERTIVSGKSRFDRWITGDATQLNDREYQGFRIFSEKTNCTVCHRGFNFSDHDFSNIGIDNGDAGRGGVKNVVSQHGNFKTPTLRNVSLSAPYFHDGSVKTLKEAVTICAQGGRDKHAKNLSGIMIDHRLSDGEIEDIVLFLKSLEE